MPSPPPPAYPASQNTDQGRCSISFGLYVVKMPMIFALTFASLCKMYSISEIQVYQFKNDNAWFTGFFIFSGRSGQGREGSCPLCSGTEFDNSRFSLIHPGYTEHNVNKVQEKIIQLTWQSYILFLTFNFWSSNPWTQIRIRIDLKSLIQIAIEPVRVHSTRWETGLSFYFINFINPPNCKKNSQRCITSRRNFALI